MKPTSDQLFFLIKSLTKSEKKYFHQYAQRHVKGQRNNYLSLFAAISKQKIYDEEQLKMQFKHEKFASYFPVAKRYLYQQITESLHQFHLAHSIEAQVRKELHIIQILLDKNLHQQAQKILGRVKAKIYQYELFSILPDSLMLERQAWDQHFYKNASVDAPKQWKEEMQNALADIRQETEFAFLNSTISRWHFQKISLLQTGKKNELEDLLGTLEQNDARAPSSLRSKMDYFRAMSTYHFMKAEPIKAYTYNQQLLQLFEQNPKFQEIYPHKYLSVLNNFLIDNHQLKKYEVLESGIKKLKTLPKQKAFKRIPSFPQKVFELSTLLELNTFIDQEQFSQALLQLPEIEQQLDRYKSKISKHYQLTFYYLIALVYFENKQFEACQTWLNYLQQDNAKNILEELFRFANLLFLLTHYELGHYELLSHLILSVRRRHSQLNTLFQTEVLLFRLLRNLSNAATKQDKQAYFRSFRVAIIPLKQKGEEKRVFNYFNWIRWVEGHLR